MGNTAQDGKSGKFTRKRGKTSKGKENTPDLTFKEGETYVKNRAQEEAGISLFPPKNEPTMKPSDDGLNRSLVIRGIKATIKLAKKLKQPAVVMKGHELLGKIEGSLDRNVIKKIELTGKDGGPIEYQDYTIEELKAKLKRSVDRINQDGRVH